MIILRDQQYTARVMEFELVHTFLGFPFTMNSNRVSFLRNGSQAHIVNRKLRVNLNEFFANVLCFALFFMSNCAGAAFKVIVHRGSRVSRGLTGMPRRSVIDDVEC
jgi:hypothetical protein